VTSANPQPDAVPGDVIVNVFGRTDVGRVRDHNEDAFLVADLTADNASLQPEVRTHLVGSHGSLFMVADGLGGAAAGEVASELAILTVQSELRAQWRSAPERNAEVFARAIKSAAESANAKIFAYAVEHPESRGLGTTATIAGLLGDTLYLAQVGDSRAYLVRNGVALQITKDQSLMQRLIEAGELTPEEAERSERRNIILQALGPEPTVKIDLTYQKVRRGDTLVLCTDGLSGLVRKEEIAEILQESNDDLLTACRELIDRANENGGPDNITVIVARFEGEGLMAPDEEEPVGHAVFPLPSSATPTAPRERFTEGSTKPFRRRNTEAVAAPEPEPVETDTVAPIVSPRPMSRKGRSILFLVAGILLAITVLLALRIYRTGVIHRTKPEPVRPTPADSGIRA
jgi:serine/threonine protein phosphatase PrpC